MQPKIYALNVVAVCSHLHYTQGCEGEGEEYDNLAVYNEALLGTMGDYLWNNICTSIK